MKKIISMTLAVMLILTCLVSCSSQAEDEYYTRTNRNNLGRVCISMSILSKEGTNLSEEELKKIYSDALDVFTDAYSFFDTTGELSIVNAPVDVVLDSNKTILDHIEKAFSYSTLTDGLYQPCGGALTSLYKGDDSPDKEQIKEALKHVGCDKLEITKNNVKKSDPLTTVDLYAYRDGYALSKICEFLKDTPVAYGTVTFNGIAGVFGKKSEDQLFAVEIGNGDDGIFNISDGYVALVSEGFGSSYDFSDGVIDPTLEKAAVYSPDALTAAIVASVAYANGPDKLFELYDKGELKFEAVLTKADKTRVYTKKAEGQSLYTPITTAQND